MLKTLYVAPARRFAGVSKALLAALEAALAGLGVKEARLTSTATARRFYLDAGWADAGASRGARPAAGHPMRKRLGAAP